MLTRLVNFLLRKYLKAAKDKFDSDCQGIHEALNEKQLAIDEELKNQKLISEHEINKSRKEAEKILHSATAEAQAKLSKAAKIGDVLTIEMYRKDIYGRPFFRIAPLLDNEGYCALKDGTGCMKCKLVYPDGSIQVVKLIPYKG